ncbi:TPR repeat-containing protein [Flavobacterium anhuiense]|uniref:TPR repeat-containing protein n=1 Tax=Flavobacterium anhuiense TaxID=459526 RepID=A0A444VVQ4_9FLAO|nr:tetratricopeptide repeat-containing sensor histidine kinase [Flavobacterium anhuiense]RYJ37791.1 TPR repeat-containing protein [Flavobacterium anhuiense]
MIKNLLPFFQKKNILFSLLIICLILATLFFVSFSKAEKKQKNHTKTDLSNKIKKTSEKAHAFFDAGKYDSAYFYFNKTQLLCDPKEDYADAYVGSLNYIVEILQRYGNFYEAEATLIKAFPYLDKTSSKKYAINAYTFMAFNYFYTYNNEKALYYHRKALKTAISTFRKARILSEIAFVYVQQKKFQEAKDILEPISKCKIADKITPSNTNLVRSGILYNLALSYIGLGNHKEQALKCLDESLELTIPYNNDFELIANYFGYYLYYSKYYNPELKKFYAEKSYHAAKRAKSAGNEIDRLADLLKMDKAEKAKKYWEIYTRKNDSLYLSRKTAKNQFADVIYDSKKDKEENFELKNQKAERELQLQRQKNRSYISYVVISLSLFIILFLIFYITTKGKREKNDIILKSEMRISQKLHNELNSNIYETLLFVQDHNLENQDNKEKLLDSLNNIYSKTRNISRENSKVPTDERYLAILKEMISEYKTKDVNIILNGFDSVFWSKIDKNKKIILYRILQELLFNMKKSNSSSLVSIIVKEINKNLLISYTDNSNEIISENNILEKRLQNVENRIETIKGTFNFDSNSESGFKISFKFPI